MARVSEKGQITIPQAVREAMGIYPGTEVEFELKNGEWVLRKLLPTEAVEKWRGYLQRKGSTDELLKEIRGEDRA